MVRLSLLGILLVPVLAWSADAPVPTRDAAGKMKLPPGFKVQLFAGEPDVVQPIAFTFDDRGRMWVVECLMYPKWSQDGKGGKDRVIILEDTDGDGKYDKKTVVLDDGVNLSGIELGFGGVYLCSSPNLIFLQIKDDKPAGKPEILLDGWNIKDAKHNVFNGLIWGPDGWLYGCNGIQTKSKVGKPGTPEKDRVLFDCGVWRFHPTRKLFEVVATGTTNPWGLDFDEHGEMFITNCVIDHLFHVVPGGRYTRMYGQDYNPHTYGYMGSAVDYKHWGGGHWTESRADLKTGTLRKEHDDAGGGHAHAGCAIYLGDNFPKEYRNTLFTANIHGNRLNNDGLERTKTGMKGVRRPDFLFANDPWFRGICVKQGPAGELFVSDWCDTGECHNYDKADTTNGRIYRVTYGDLKPWKGDVSKMTDEELVKAVTSQNEWLSRKARRVLQERVQHELGDLDKKTLTTLRQAFWDAKTDAETLRVAWALAAVLDLRETELRTLNGHKSDALRAWGFRLTADRLASEPEQTIDMLRASRMEDSVFVRLYLYGLIHQLPNEVARTLVREIGTSIPDTETNLALMYWYAVQRLIERDGVGEAHYWLKGCPSTLARRFIVRRYLSTPVPEKKHISEVISHLKNSDSDELRRAILLGMKDALGDQSRLGVPDGWSQLDFTNSPADVRLLADELAFTFGDETAIKKMRDRTADASRSTDDRARALALLAGRKTPGFDADLRKLLSDSAVRAAALRGLANYADDKTPGVILDLYPKLTADEKADAVQTLSSRASYASVLLDAVEKGTVPKGDITAFTARQIANLKDKAVVEKLGKVWGEVKTGSANAKAKIAEYKNKLTPDVIAKGNVAKGKVLFAKTCGTCHKLHGEGQAVGPELTGSQRANLDYVLENVIDPSSAVANEYKMTQFFLEDGRVLNGFIKEQSATSMILRTVNDEVRLLKSDIAEQKKTNLSLMPDGLFDALKPDEVIDLVAYLQKP